MFVSVRICGNTLEYNAYTFDGTNAELYDTYNVKKNTFLPVEELLKEAPAAGEVTVFDAEKIEEALDAYGELVPRAQDALSSEALAKIESYSELPLADYLAAYPVVRAIAELGEAEASAEFSSALKQLKRLYADLTESQQALVSNYAEIAAAENSMIDIYAADAVTKMISRYRAGLDGLTIEEVRLAYAALTPVQQALVTGTEGLDLTIPAPAESQSPSSCNSSLSVVAAGVTGLVLLAILQRRREK